MALRLPLCASGPDASVSFVLFLDAVQPASAPHSSRRACFSLEHAALHCGMTSVCCGLESFACQSVGAVQEFTH